MNFKQLFSNKKTIHLLYLSLITLVLVTKLQCNSNNNQFTTKSLINKLENNNHNITKKNSRVLGLIERKGRNIPSLFMDDYLKATKIVTISQELNKILDQFKISLLTDFEKNTFLTNKNILLNSLNKYKDSLLTFSQEDKIYKNDILNKIKHLNLDEVFVEKNSIKPESNNQINKLEIAARISLVQYDISIITQELLLNLSGLNHNDFLSFKSYRAIVVPQKTACLEGENFKGRIVLGRVDVNTKPNKVILNGQEIDKKNFKDDGVVLNFPVGKIGENELKGQFIFMENGYPVTVPIESSYFVLSNSK